MSIDYSRDPAVLKLQRHELARLVTRQKDRMAKRPCVCQGYVTADPIDPTPGVRAHNATLQHESWRERNER